MSFSPENLFHFKRYQERYSIKPDDFINLPLFYDQVVTCNTYLKEVFFLVLSRFFHWQSTTEYRVPVDEAGAAVMARSVWSPFGATSSGPAMPATPTISKKMVARQRHEEVGSGSRKRLRELHCAQASAWYHCFWPKPVDPADKAEQAAVAEAEAAVNGCAAPVDGLLLSDAE